MKPHLHKGITIATRRLPFVSYNFLYNLLPGVLSFVISYLVVRIKGVAIWGEYVYISTVISFIVLVAQWGNKDQLLRDFSFKPAAIAKQWYGNVSARSAFFLLLLILSSFIFSNEIAILCIFWLMLLWMAKISEVLYVYQKRFHYLLASEIIYGIVASLVITIYYHSLTLQILLWASLIGILLKGIFLYRYLSLFIFPIPKFTPNWHFLRQGFPFFILSMVGLFEARIDFFCINLLLGKQELGKYSLLFNLLLLLKNVPGFFVEPFTKNLYRSPIQVFHKLGGQLAILGLGISIVGVIGIHYFYEGIYKLHYSWFFYGTAVLYVWPRFIFSMNIYRFFQQKREYLLVIGTLLGIAINTGLNFLWLNKYGLEMAIVSAAIGQWVMLIYFKGISNLTLS